MTRGQYFKAQNLISKIATNTQIIDGGGPLYVYAKQGELSDEIYKLTDQKIQEIKEHAQKEIDQWEKELEAL